MSDEQPWERREGEPGNWYARFLLYRDMGPARTLNGAFLLAQKSPKKPKKAQLSGAWKDVAKQWEWRRRAEAWDEEEQRVALASCTFARMSERVKILNRWVGIQDTIMVTSLTERGYVRADSMEQMRGLLDDIAKETGGRIKLVKSDTTTHEVVDQELLDKFDAIKRSKDAKAEGQP